MSDHPRFTRAFAVAAALLAGLLAFASPAAADGDPASDYLLMQKVFVPFDLKLAKADEQRLIGLVEATNKAGFQIRVAVLDTPYDMGAVASLWLKPRPYARFLAQELKFIYKQRLLIVMPNGFGFEWRNHPVDTTYARLAPIRITRTPSGLANAAERAVQTLAAAEGVHVSAQIGAIPADHTNRDRLIIISAATALILTAFAARLLLRRRRGA